MNVQRSANVIDIERSAKFIDASERSSLRTKMEALNFRSSIIKILL